MLTRVRRWLPRSVRACVQLFPRSWLQVGVDVPGQAKYSQIRAGELLVRSPLRSLTPES
ncbi:hypothetical protein TEQG_00360 [Trichophyton equinum CBS 127.97]|uniref:Uncharacterized protein n=1 Tax=Trichophyton equinum (strain ATCC MYA-4606 / CBS 127.97) TaxID=559882 RepID=F2PHD9_TRIEC|nr:hypothetical protein TEQG_00360 [Trichophyton equinum CBS 127.97]